MNDQDSVVVVKDLYKSFKLPHEQSSGIKQSIVNFTKRKKGYEIQRVLKDVSFEIKKGEFFAIVGRNGSGKSTLLKLLAGIYTPDKGLVQINGSLTPFIELGVGFNPELTGRENIYLNGALLGFSRSEMDQMYDSIVSFAELEKFMDQKLKNYSSGMQVRLAFSIAIQAQSDILLLDEVLAVGDAAFQRKCFEYFGELKHKKQTVIFISHDMGSVRKYCDRGILIDKGEVKFSGSTEEIIKEYSKLFMENDAETAPDEIINEVPLGMSPTSRINRDEFKIDKFWISTKDKKSTTTLKNGTSEFQVNLEVQSTGKTTDFIPGIIVQNTLGEFVTSTNSEWAETPVVVPIEEGKKTVVTFDLPNVYEEGEYKVSCNVVSSDSTTFYAWKNQSLKLLVERSYQTGGKAYPIYSVRYE